ncbi:glycosyltransferase [Tateyamaria sp. SN3-11]|uniref:glycosyltransferase n=1 Tax=Tateyamaria sp. SN3-11 TaxID=3092147 RepID=UPI0039E9AD2F
MRAIFSSYGSLGDIHPFLAIAKSLRTHGVECVFITNISNAEAVKRAGFEAHGIATDVSVLFERAGLPGEAAIEATHEDVRVFWRLCMPEFSGYLQDVDDIVGDASVIISPPWAFNVQSIAEKRGIPFVGTHLWPLGFLSAYDPPVLRDLPGLIKQPSSKVAVAWNSFVVFCAKKAMKPLFSKYLNPPRLAYGLGKVSRPPVLDFLVEPELVLGLFSEHFAPRTPDMPEKSDLTGFPTMQNSAPKYDAELDAFMDKEPIVFTLGSILSKNPGTFYTTSVAAAQSLGINALILTDNPSLIPQTPGVLVRGYVPHSEVFPRARVIVHHGGIGTTAQALRSGKPQLVVPHFGDQPDNGARVEKLGLGRVLPSTDYSTTRAVAILSEIVSSQSQKDRALYFKSKIDSENGADHAADIIFKMITTG